MTGDSSLGNTHSCGEHCIRDGAINPVYNVQNEVANQVLQNLKVKIYIRDRLRKDTKTN